MPRVAQVDLLCVPSAVRLSTPCWRPPGRIDSKISQIFNPLTETQARADRSQALIMRIDFLALSHMQDNEVNECRSESERSPLITLVCTLHDDAFKLTCVSRRVHRYSSGTTPECFHAVGHAEIAGTYYTTESPHPAASIPVGFTRSRRAPHPCFIPTHSKVISS